MIPPLLRGWLRTRPLRGVLAALAVALGVAALLAVQITLTGLDDQAGAAQRARAGDSGVDVRTVSGPGLDASDLARLRALHGVAAVSPLLEKSVAARFAAGAVEGLDVAVVGLDGGRAALRPLHLVSGRLPRDGSLSEVVLDQGVASALRSTGAAHTVRPGESVRLVTRDGDTAFTVVGVAATGSGGPAFSGASVFVSHAAATGPFGMGLRTPLAALRLAPGASAVAVAAAAQSALRGTALAVDPRAGAAAPLDQIRPLLLLVVALAGLICAGVCANTTALAVSERRREIGLLRAAGAGPRQVLRLLLAEAGVLGLAGAALGVGAGALLGAAAVTRLGAADQPTPALALEPWRLVGSAVAGIAAAMLGALLPALAAARMQPLEALRSAAEPATGRAVRRLALAGVALVLGGAVASSTGVVGAVVAGCSVLLVGTALCLPLVSAPLLRAVGAALSPLTRTAPVAAAALARRRRRTALTLAGLVVSVATATALSALSSGAVNAGDRWVTRIFAGDVVVHSPATQRAAIAQLVATTPGVRQVTPVRFLSAVAGDNPLGVAAIDPVAHQASGALDVVDGDRQAALTALSVSPTVLVPQQLESELGWHRGSRITLTAGPGSLQVTVAGVVAHSLPAGDGREALLIGSAMAGRLYGPAEVSGFDDLEVVTTGAGALAAVSRVAATYGMNAVPVATIRDDARQSLGNTLSLLGVLSWMAVAIAMLAVVNTLLVNARQGTRDLALLRAAGLSRRRALRLVLTEAGLLATTGVVLGVAAGCAMALPLLRAGSSPGFEPQFALPVGTALAALGAVVIGSLLAVALPARRAARAAIVSAIRHD